jgi:hypothetical protein
MMSVGLPSIQASVATADRTILPETLVALGAIVSCTLAQQDWGESSSSD